MKRLQANGLVLIIRPPCRIKFPFTAGRPLPIQTSAAIFVTVSTALVESGFILNDGKIYFYDTAAYANSAAIDASFRVTSALGFFTGSPWGGVWWNSYLASQTVFKHL